MKKKLLYSLNLIIVALLPTAKAVSISITADNVGPITFLDANGPETSAGFQLGESLRAIFTFDNGLSDLDPAPGSASFTDPNGTITLIGITSGASLNYVGGLNIELDDNEELELKSALFIATSLNSPTLKDDIDFDTQGSAFFSNPDSLAVVISDLDGAAFPNDVSSNIASTEYWNGNASVLGMEFGPVPSVPEPVNFSVISTPSTSVPDTGSTAALFVSGLLGLAVIRRKLSK